MSQLALNAGYEMDSANADVDNLMIATTNAANGVDTYLKEVLSDIISPLELNSNI